MSLERILSSAHLECSVNRYVQMDGKEMSLIILPANTDTKQMWNVTKNIYRFTPALLSENVNQHTVDEVRMNLADQQRMIVN